MLEGITDLVTDKIKWYGHSSFKIKGDLVIYIDPWKVQDSEKADIILITHDHFDHFSKEDIERLKNKSTLVIGNNNVAKKLGSSYRVKSGETLFIKNVKIDVVPAYNVDKKFHPKKHGGVGYIIETDGVRYYHSGDTDYIPEMNDIKDIDVALLPVSGTYVMNAEEAFNAVKSINPNVAIPMHYGDIVGDLKDAEKFKALASKYCSVEILGKN
ncbi:MBL fold metallo-hydrolase [Candidatus Woesearchaeota archaeon]|nr:MBL fold metallo-hydrolase [Candidatus Woesearchaeota archaeon]